MSVGRELVFVYGTLRSGGTHHFRMAGAELVASGTVCGRIYRFDWYPGLVLGESGDEITGEVYAVGPALLAELDLFEGLSAGEIEGSEYRRVRAKVRTGSGETITAWVWEWRGAVEETQRIAGGDWLKEPGV